MVFALRLLVTQYFGYYRVAALFSGCLFKFICPFPLCDRQILQQLGLFLPVFGQCLLCAFKQLFGLLLVEACNFKELFG